jgi:hypothetical protein
MPGEDSASSRYRPVFSQAMRERVRHLIALATLQRRESLAIRSLREIVDRIASDAAEFGEPLYRLRSLQCEVRCAALLPWKVHFLVPDAGDHVFIKWIDLLPMRRGSLE